MAAPRLAYCILPVRNMVESLQFYTQTLGFQLRQQTQHWSELETGSQTKIALHLCEEAEQRSPQVQCSTHNPAVGLFVDDLDAFHTKLIKSGVTCLQQPALQFWGGKMARYLTPKDSHVLSVVEAKGFPADVRPASQPHS